LYPRPSDQRPPPPDDWNRLSYGSEADYMKSGRGDTGYGGRQEEENRLSYYRNGESPQNAFASSGSSVGQFASGYRNEGPTEPPRHYGSEVQYPIEETGWGDELPEAKGRQTGGNPRATPRQFQQQPPPSQQRCRSDSRGTSESESGW
jgi:hypothetical protein